MSNADTTAPLRIAIVGSGVAGLTAAYLLQHRHAVTVYEKLDRLGGHTNTVIVPNGPDSGTPVDTGFIVLNNKNYPLLTRLLSKLGCATRWSDMSFGFYSEDTGLAYAGTGLSGLFAQRRNVLSPWYLGFLRDIVRFCSQARKDLAENTLGDMTLTQYLLSRNCSHRAIRFYIIPMGAAIWSAPYADMMNFPAATMLRFWDNHGLLSTEDRPKWQTVVGGSSAYVEALRRSFSGTMVTKGAIQSVERTGQGVQLRFASGAVEEFDRVIMAAHADESLKLLADPSEAERSLLGAWRYQPNRTVLHTDISFLPANRRAWASWNYTEPLNAPPSQPVPVTYWMNLLQGLKTREQYCVTLNPHRPIHPGRIVYETNYTHPVFDAKAVAAQQQLPSLNGVRNTYFCGSYFGHGFHEDAVRSGVAAAKQFGVDFT